MLGKFGGPWRFALCCAWMLFACRPAAHLETLPPPQLQLSSYQLANGLRVVIAPDDSVSSVVVHIWYQVGSKDEPVGKTGFAHLFEHLMFEGSAHVAEGDFDELLEEVGGTNNGSTTNDRTNYYMQVPARQLELALWLEADRLAGLWDAMNQRVLDNQREVVKNERRQSYENRPYGLADLRLPELLWPPGHGNAHPAIGSMEDLTAASLADVEAFWRSHYVPGKAILVIAGNVDVAEARRLVERYFAWIPGRPLPKATYDVTPPLPQRIEETLRQDVSTAKVIMAWRGPPAYTQAVTDLQVFAHVLAGSKTSRLHDRLVVRDQSATEAVAFVDPMLLGSEFQVHATGLSKTAPERLAAAVEAELEEACRAGVTPQEVRRARRVIESSLLRHLEVLETRAETLAEYVAYTDDPNFLRKDLAMLAKVSPASIQKACTEWLGRDHAVVLTIVPERAR